jgi:glutamate racemase
MSEPESAWERRDGRPIALFDSGWGGLSVAMAIHAVLPGEDLHYLGDHAWCPYGERRPEEVAARAVTIAKHLARADPKIIVVACNTASALGLERVREAVPGIEVVGVVPAVKPAALRSRSGTIAVLATPATAGSDYLAGLVRDHAGSSQVLIVPGPGLVELVEQGAVAGEAVRALLAGLLGPALSKGADAVVLGCTHYPFLRPVIEQIAGPGVSVIDSGEAIARRVRSLIVHEQPDPIGRIGRLHLVTTGDPERVSKGAAELIGAAIPVERISL